MQDLQNLQGTINGLDQSGQTVFKNKNAKSALIDSFDAVIKAVNDGKYTRAIDKLQSGTLSKVDGCASPLKQPDKNDLITNCQAQGQVYPEMKYIVEEIKILQTP